MGWQKCITSIKDAAGVDFSDGEVERILDHIMDRARKSKSPHYSALDQLDLAGAELAQEVTAAALIEKRNATLNLLKRISRRQFYLDAPSVGLRDGSRTPGPVIGLEAKLVGVNTPFQGSRLSVDAQGLALVDEYVGGLTADLDKAGLFEAMKSGQLDREWARELYELTKPDGAIGVTGNTLARQIAEIVHKHQKAAVDGLNRAGAWIGEYEGYIARTTHDPDRIRRAGYDAWRKTVLEKLHERTFAGLEDPSPAGREAFLKGVYQGLASGVHLTQDGLQGFKDPAFTGPGNTAKKLSQGRHLHFFDADAWLDYNAEFGSGNLAESVLRSLELAARNTALMREFGTNPRAELEADLRWLEETRRGDLALIDGIRDARKRLSDQMDILDGRARMPVNVMAARIGAGIRAWNRLSKLGGILLSAVTDIPLKAAELRYQGINLLEREADGLTSVFRGRGSGETREVMDLLRAGLEGMRGDLAARFDAADTTPGRLAKISNTFFRWTGIKYWTDAQRAGAELVMARHLAQQADRDFASMPERLRRVLGMYGIDAGKWDMLRSAELAQADGRRYLTPDAAQRVDEAKIRAYLEEGGILDAKTDPLVAAGRIRDFRSDLALQLQAYFSDRGQFAVINPGARERAFLLRGTQPGTLEGEALRFIGELKSFPVAVITKALGRELYGGQGGYGATAGMVHMMAAATVFGYLAMAAKDLAKGRTPRDPQDPKTWAAAFVQGGGGGIYGDFIVGEYSRFGRSLLASLAGPTLGQIDDVAEIWSRIKQGDAPSSQAFRWAMNNAPFVNLFYTRLALDYAVSYQVMEALNPGFLRRLERRIEKENNQTFILRPSSAIPHGGGGRILEGVR